VTLILLVFAILIQAAAFSRGSTTSAPASTRFVRTSTMYRKTSTRSTSAWRGSKEQLKTLARQTDQGGSTHGRDRLLPRRLGAARPRQVRGSPSASRRAILRSGHSIFPRAGTPVPASSSPAISRTSWATSLGSPTRVRCLGSLPIARQRRSCSDTSDRAPAAALRQKGWTPLAAPQCLGRLDVGLLLPPSLGNQQQYLLRTYRAISEIAPSKCLSLGEAVATESVRPARHRQTRGRALSPS
jgi:hypothetical protein